MGEHTSPHELVTGASLAQSLWPHWSRHLSPDIVVAARESGHKSHKSLASFTNKASLAPEEYATDCKRRRRNSDFLTSP